MMIRSLMADPNNSPCRRNRHTPRCRADARSFGPELLDEPPVAPPLQPAREPRAAADRSPPHDGAPVRGVEQAQRTSTRCRHAVAGRAEMRSDIPRENLAVAPAVRTFRRVDR